MDNNILREAVLMSNPYYRRNELDRLLKLQEYFTDLKCKILGSVCPKILINTKKQTTEYIYPDYINKAIKTVNEIEENYFIPDYKKYYEYLLNDTEK